MIQISQTVIMVLLFTYFFHGKNVLRNKTVVCRTYYHSQKFNNKRRTQQLQHEDQLASQQQICSMLLNQHSLQ